jgi:NAD/NADP transhydrogenase beta subunit
METHTESAGERSRLEKYLNDRLDSCKTKLKKLKSKKKKIKIIYYMLIISSILGSSAALIVSTLIVPPLVITILSGISTIAVGLSTRFKLEDEKNKIEQKISEVNEIEDYLQYVTACNGDLTQEKIKEIYNKFKMFY